MILERLGIKIYDLRFDARDEVYTFIDKYYKPMPKNPDGTINVRARGLADNDIDALRHSYVSAVYVIEYGEEKADFLGRLNELITFERDPLMENMDLWNNSVGRSFGKKTKRGKELFDVLMKSLKNGELILDLKDPRKYKGEKMIKRKPKSLVITIQETKTGANIQYYDVINKKVFSKKEFLDLIKEGKYPGYSFKTVAGSEIPVSNRDRFKFNNLG
jgi:hypothetical protein